MSHKVTSIITTDRAVHDKEQRLSICLRSNGFSFSITAQDNKLLTFGEVEMEMVQPLCELMQSLRNFMAELHISPLDFAAMRLIIPSVDYAWMPEHLYNSVCDRQYLKMVSSPALSMGAFHIFCPQMKSYMVFSAPSDVVTAFKVVLPGIDCHCQHSAFVSSSLLMRSSQHPLILLHVRDGFADLEALDRGQLLLSKSFESNGDNELLYHTLDVMKILNVESPSMELAICGLVGREIFGLLQHYFPNVTLYCGEPITFDNPQFQTLPTYKHALLLS